MDANPAIGNQDHPEGDTANSTVAVKRRLGVCICASTAQEPIMGNKASKHKIGYLDQVAQLALRKDPKAGVFHVVVEHKDHCAMMNRGRECTCNALVTLCEGSA